MSRYFQRPENAISKAEEFIKVGKDNRALDTLYEVIKSKKRNHNFSEKLLEKIMFKYLELCVELKKSHVAKEGLYQYRNMCQSTNVASLASVVQFYLSSTEKKTEAARQASKDSVADVDDLENLATPEMIMLSAVSGEDAQDRSDRTILMPWVKFLWESYCQCLELLRTNVRVERLYHDIAQQAFRFCLKYQRKTEFRKLCEKLRTHLELTLKQTSSPMSINLNNPDTQQFNLDTRLIQLDAAVQLELWQEAYKAIEDIHGLMVISKKIYQPKTMSNYYQKVALVYWKSGCHLFHAAAVLKHFQLNRDMKKNISQEELSKMASRVLVAVLAIPQPSQHPEFDKFIEMDRTPQEKMARLALQLGLQQPPTRTSLIKDVYRFGVLQFATPEIQNLYQVLEVDFSPLKLCSRVQEVLDFIEGSEDMSILRQYVPSLKQVTLVRLLRQVSQSYQSICFNRLLELAPFTDAFSLERMIVDCVRHNDMQIRIDHRTRTIHFGTDLVESQSHDVADGPHIQDMPSEQIRNQLMVMMEVLEKSVRTIHPDKLKLENNVLRQKIIESYHQSKQREHERILQRRKTIEDRKEYLEKRALDLAAEEDAKREQILREQQELEEKRLESERIEREQRKREEEIRQIQQRHIKEKVEQIAQTEIGKKVLDKLDENEIAELDADQIMKRQVIELEKEKRELISRLKSQEKKIDHFERAKRQEEIPLLLEHFKEDQEQDKVFWAKKEEDRIAQAKSEREVALSTQERLSRMKDDKNSYFSQLLKERKSEFEKKLKEFNQLMEKEKARRLVERKELRKAERREKWIKEKKEEEQRLRDEELKREREEKQRLEREREMEEEKAWQKKNAEMESKNARQKDMEENRERDAQRAPMSDRRDGSSYKSREYSSPTRETHSESSNNWRDDPRKSGGMDFKRGEPSKRPGDRGSSYRRDDRPDRRDDRFDRRDDRFDRRDDRFERKDDRFERKDDRFDRKDDRFDRKDDRFERKDDRFERKDDRFERKDDRFDRKDDRFDRRDDRFDRRDDRFDRRDDRFDRRDDRFERRDDRGDGRRDRDRGHDAMDGDWRQKPDNRGDDRKRFVKNDDRSRGPSNKKNNNDDGRSSSNWRSGGGSNEGWTTIKGGSKR